jgi:hypothetical protein
LTESRRRLRLNRSKKQFPTGIDNSRLCAAIPRYALLGGIRAAVGLNKSMVLRAEFDRGAWPLALIMAAAALTMIKENLTSSFLWSARPIGCPSGRGMSFAARSGPLPNDDPGGAQADALVTRGPVFTGAADLVQRN